MPAENKILEFIVKAKASGASEQTIVGILTARGWPEREVYDALAARYEGLTGTQIPSYGGIAHSQISSRPGKVTAAKDAFFYLLAFSTLATWTIGLGSLSFDLIDQWLADTLFSAGLNPAYDAYGIATALASILVAFPIYLAVTRAIVRDAKSHPEKLNSSVRKWLTYMALAIAAGVFIGDLVTALTFFLRGEITSRFLARAFTVLVISGGVFFYYYSGLRKAEQPESSSGPGRDLAAGIASTVIVGLMVTLGFARIGGPGAQRLQRADQERQQDLYMLSEQIHNRWQSNGYSLPHDLSELSGAATSDPVTHGSYEYHAKQGSQYELCATFSTGSKNANGAPSSSAWAHPAGRQCFALDAAVTAPNPYAYYPN
jgi:Domain of unknown function (DUF5671)